MKDFEYNPDYQVDINITVSTKCPPKDTTKIIEEIFSTLQPLADKYQIDFYPILTGREVSLKKQG